MPVTQFKAREPILEATKSEKSNLKNFKKGFVSIVSSAITQMSLQ